MRIAVCMTTAADIIDTLGGYRAVADALSLPYTTVHSWCRHNAIPAWRWPDILGLAAKAGVALNADQRPIRNAPEAARAA